MLLQKELHFPFSESNNNLISTPTMNSQTNIKPLTVSQTEICFISIQTRLFMEFPLPTKAFIQCNLEINSEQLRMNRRANERLRRRRFDVIENDRF